MSFKKTVFIFCDVQIYVTIWTVRENFWFNEGLSITLFTVSLFISKDRKMIARSLLTFLGSLFYYWRGAKLFKTQNLKENRFSEFQNAKNFCAFQWDTFGIGFSLTLEKDESIDQWNINHVEKEGFAPTKAFAKEIVFGKVLVTAINAVHIPIITVYARGLLDGTGWPFWISSFHFSLYFSWFIS